jgi:hypothetical protein
MKRLNMRTTSREDIDPVLAPFLGGSAVTKGLVYTPGARNAQ